MVSNGAVVITKTGNQRWISVQGSEFTHEQEAIDLLRARLPETSPFRGWSNFEFVAEDGSINEVDALVMSSDRIYLVEIKHYFGTISGNQSTWTIRTGGRDRVEDNPLLLTNRKAKKLKSLLQKTKPFNKKNGLRVPFIQPVVFLSHRECQLDLNDVAIQHLYLRPDGRRKGRPSIIDVIDGTATRDEGRLLFGRDVERALARGLDELGLRRRSSSATVSDYKLKSLLLEHDRFQDWEGVHSRIENDRRRIRIFPYAQKAASSEKSERKDLALREYKLLNPIHHAGILRPLQLTDCEIGPALVFELYEDSVRLDHFIESGLAKLPLDERLDLIRGIAEALNYAHKHDVCHRALSPWTIDLTPRLGGGWQPVIRDWQAATHCDAAAAGSTLTSTIHSLTQISVVADDLALLHCAPEAIANGEIQARALDIFSLGTIAYSILSGRAPAESPEALISQCLAGPGLRLSAVLDGAPDALEELIQYATDADPAGRPGSIDEFLDLLDRAEDELTTPEPKVGVHPRDARAGDELTGGFIVQQRLGSGSTAMALAVEFNGKTGVLKIAKEPALNDRLRDEAATLRELTHANIAKIYSEHEIDGLAALFLELAGEQTLAQRIQKEGALSLDLLERFGDELLSVLIYLEREGINHRDIKPENLGVGLTRKKALTLKLFDFSLARTPADNIRAGTRPYLDPFLSERKPPRWDLSAERFGAAMTLHELATGAPPSWNHEDPAQSTSDVQLDIERFDPSLRDKLTQFFRKALARTREDRYDNAEEMHTAWRAVFQSLATIPGQTDTDAAEDVIDLSGIEDIDHKTRLSALNLSPRLLNGADRLGAATVGELLALPGIRFYRNKGLGQRVTRKLRELRDELTERLAEAPAFRESADSTPETQSIDRLVRALTGIQINEPDMQALKCWLALAQHPVSDLPTMREAAEHAAMPRGPFQAVIETAVEKWSKNRWMTALRDDIADFVQKREGIVTLDELSARLLGLRGCAASGEARQRMVGAVIQAAVESEVIRQNARFVWHRNVGPLLLIATDQLGSSFLSPAPARAAYARALAARVSALASNESLPATTLVQEELEAIPAPDDDEPMSAERRLRLAVAAAGSVALSSRLELYPKGMPAAQALRLGSGALLGPKRLSVQQLQARIHSRFPHAEPLPDRPALDELLDAAEIPLEWQPASDGQAAGYAPPHRGSGFTRHSSTLRGTTIADGDEHSPEAQSARRFEANLKHALDQGQFQIVTSRPATVERAAQALSQKFQLQRYSLDKLLIDTLHAEANKLKARWDVVLKADATAQDSGDWRKLQALIARVMPVVQQTLFDNPHALLLEHPGLLLRYGKLDLLQRLRDRAHQGGSPARILLVPGDPESPAPKLDGVALPIITTADVAVVPRRWLQIQAASTAQSKDQSTNNKKDKIA